MSLFLLLSLAFLPDDALSAGEAAGKLALVYGSVAIQKTGVDKVLPARAGDTLFVGDLLKTTTDSGARAVLADDSSVTLSSGTAVRINQYSFEAGTKRRTAVVKVLNGRARFVVKQQHKDSLFKVETEHALIAAGTADFAIVASPGETAVNVLDGYLSVRNISYLTVGEVDLGPNQSSVVKSKVQPSRPAVITFEERRKFIRDAKHF
jgi:ferric-dicitrate binding protein FerR (iron transport regulator)